MQGIRRAVICEGKMIRLPVHLAEATSRVRKATGIMVQKLGREPDLTELASEASLPVEKVVSVLQRPQPPVSLDVLVGDEQDHALVDILPDHGTSVSRPVMGKILIEEFERAFEEDLDPREQEVIRLRYGLQSGIPMTLDEVGKHFQLTRERIRQIEKRALKKLFRNRTLRDTVGIPKRRKPKRFLYRRVPA